MVAGGAERVHGIERVRAGFGERVHDWGRGRVESGCDLVSA